MNTRRHFLRSSTALIALPFLESLGFRRFASAATVSAPPKRLLFVGFGWGVTEEIWYPDIRTPGADYTLPDALQPLAGHKKDFSVLQGLWNRNSDEGHDGSSRWLTGANRHAMGLTAFNSISADQVAAAQLGLETRFNSLQISANQTEREIGGDGHGGPMAWDANGKPLGGESGPVALFKRLFAQDNTPLEKQQAMLARGQSVLDTVLSNARQLQKGLGKDDNQKLEEYFESIRNLETRLGKEKKWLGVQPPKAPFAEPEAGLEGFEEIKMTYALMIAAMKSDSTRVMTYRQPVETLLRSIGVKVTGHGISHYVAAKGEHLDGSERRDKAQSQLLAHLLDLLKSTKEADGSSLFDHCTVVYGSNIRTGHLLDNCPTIVSGRGAGIRLGENLVLPKNTPLCNLWLTLLQRSGVQVDKHGDSTAPLDSILA
ncbi:MAG: hypothetical protein RLZZ399_2843 [Verrucomicrobiota bacterium]|jgi:hypothetical protein